MAISGFGAQNNLSLGLSLNANKKQQSIVKQEETTKQEEVKKEDLQETKTAGKQINFGQVDSLLVGKGIKINKPEQAENNDEKTEITTSNINLTGIKTSFFVRLTVSTCANKLSRI